LAKLELLPYECTVCGKIFMSYFEVIDDNDKKVIKDYFRKIEEGILFVQIRNERKCPKCRKCLQLDMFFE